MKTISALALLLCVIFIHSQTHRFIYQVEYKKDSASSNVTKENYHLDISSKEIKYYKRDFFIADSLIKNNISFPSSMKLNTSNIITHNIGSNDYSDYDLIENTVLKIQTTDPQDWKLTDEKKRLNGLMLQKATSYWGKRNWTAWFCIEIPFQEGPYKFRGLPGLIIELQDDENNYRFYLIKSENLKSNPSNQFIEMSKQMAVPVSLEKYRKIKLSYFESPVSFIRNSIGNSDGNDSFFLNDGTKVNRDNVREINEILRENIRKYNNPINKNNIIRYP